jgi:hypothetical protein
MVQSKKKINRVSHDYDGSVGSSNFNIAVFDNRRVSRLKVRELKEVSLIAVIFRPVRQQLEN